MTPEEYYYKYVVKDKTIIYEMRIKSLAWMLGCYKKGTIIERPTIITKNKRRVRYTNHTL